MDLLSQLNFTLQAVQIPLEMVDTIKAVNQRAKAIADWLRGHGYDAPIYYYGFGESLLAVKTGDGVDESANRRVLYIVTSDVPPDMPM